MTPEQIKKVTGLMAQSAHINPKDFSLYIPFSAYKLDSLGIVATCVSIEEELNIEIPDETLPTLKCGNDVIKYLQGVL